MSHPNPRRSAGSAAGAWLRGLVALFTIIACAQAMPNPARTGELTSKELAQGFRDGRVLAKPKAAMLPTIDAVERGEGMTLRAQFERFGHIRVIGLSAAEGVRDAIARLRATILATQEHLNAALDLQQAGSDAASATGRAYAHAIDEIVAH